VRKEGGVTSSLFFGKDIHLRLEAGVGGYAPRPGQDLPPLYLISLYAPEQCSYVVSCLGFLHALVEHLYTGNNRFAGRPYAYYLDLFV
jgi:hypothetical protein